jgi:hypothetical protein
MDSLGINRGVETGQTPVEVSLTNQKLTNRVSNISADTYNMDLRSSNRMIVTKDTSSPKEI